MESFLLCLCNISHFSFTVCSSCNCEAIATRFRRRTSHSKIWNLWSIFIARRSSFVSSSTSVSTGKIYYGNQYPWKSVVEENRLGQLGRFSSTDYSKFDCYSAWSSQEWKNEVTTYDRSEELDKAFWRMIQQVRLHHEATLLDGSAQSVRYGESLRDRSGQLDNVNSQNAATRIFVCKKIWQKTMVIHWSWFRKEVVFCERRQSTRNLGQNCEKDAVGIRRKRMSNFPCYDSIVQRSTQK